MSKASKKSAKALLSATPAPQIGREELKTLSSSTKQKKSGNNKRNREGLQQEGLNPGLTTRTSFAALPPEQRRLDSLALLLEGNGTCAATCFDGRQILVSSNNAYMTQSGKESHTNTEKFMSIVMQYFQIVALQGRKDSSSKDQAEVIAQIEASITESLKALDNNLSSSKDSFDIRTTVFKQICLMYLQGLKTEKPSNKTINTLAEEILPLSKLKKWNKNMKLPEFMARHHDEAPKILKAVPLIFKLAKAFKKFEISLGREPDNRFHLDEQIIDLFKKGDQGGYKILKEAPGGAKIKQITHAEMHIINYLMKIFKEPALDNVTEEIYIGISKLCCLDCSLVIKAINEVGIIHTENAQNDSLSNKKIKIQESQDNQPININMKKFSMRGWHGLTFSDKWAEPAFLGEKENQHIKDQYIKLKTQLAEKIKKSGHVEMLHSDSESGIGTTSDSSKSPEQLILKSDEKYADVSAILSKLTLIAQTGNLTEDHLKTLNEIHEIAQSAYLNKAIAKQIIKLLDNNKSFTTSFAAFKSIYYSDQKIYERDLSVNKFFNEQENKKIFKSIVLDNGASLFEIFIEELGDGIRLKEEAEAIMIAIINLSTDINAAVPLSLDNTENQLAIGYFAEDEISNTSPGYFNYDEEEKIGHIDLDEQILSGDEKQQSSEQDNNGLSRCNAIANGICDMLTDNHSLSYKPFATQDESLLTDLIRNNLHLKINNIDNSQEMNKRLVQAITARLKIYTKHQGSTIEVDLRDPQKLSDCIRTAIDEFIFEQTELKQGIITNPFIVQSRDLK